jgi:hypothetical protein
MANTSLKEKRIQDARCKIHDQKFEILNPKFVSNRKDALNKITNWFHGQVK